ncbi:MAG: BON domain-containing protein [Pseudomonadota bacterium]
MMKPHNVALLGLLTIGSGFLQGCAPVAVFGGASTVGMSATEERGLRGVIDDAAIKAEVNALWFDFDPVLSESVELSVREGRVLLTGAVDTPQRQIDAVRLVWKVEGVKEVIDEMLVGDGAGIGGYVGDTWVTTKLKAELLFEPEVRSSNYNIKTYAGKVYLIGIAQDQQELDRVLEIASRVDGVKEVVNYMRLLEEKDIMLAHPNREQTMPLQEQAPKVAVADPQMQMSFPAPQAR